MFFSNCKKNENYKLNRTDSKDESQTIHQSLKNDHLMNDGMCLKTKPNAKDEGSGKPCSNVVKNCTKLKEVVVTPNNQTYILRQISLFDSIISLNDKNEIKEFIKNNAFFKDYFRDYHPSFWADMKSGKYFITKECTGIIEDNNKRIRFDKYNFGEILPIDSLNRSGVIQINLLIQF